MKHRLPPSPQKKPKFVFMIVPLILKPINLPDHRYVPKILDVPPAATTCCVRDRTVKIRTQYLKTNRFNVSSFRKKYRNEKTLIKRTVRRLLYIAHIRFTRHKESVKTNNDRCLFIDHRHYWQSYFFVHQRISKTCKIIVRIIVFRRNRNAWKDVRQKKIRIRYVIGTSKLIITSY